MMLMSEYTNSKKIHLCVIFIFFLRNHNTRILSLCRLHREERKKIFQSHRREMKGMNKKIEDSGESSAFFTFSLLLMFTVCPQN